MCEALRRLMQDEIADEVREAEIRAQRNGEMKAKRETALTLASMGMSAEKIAEAVKVSLKIVQESVKC